MPLAIVLLVLFAFYAIERILILILNSVIGAGFNWFALMWFFFALSAILSLAQHLKLGSKPPNSPTVLYYDND